MYHKLTIAGNLARDPEMRYMADGTAVTSFNVAVSDGWGDNKKTIWFKVNVWGKRAEVANQYLTKGSRVLVEGRLSADDSGSPRLWTRKDGTVSSSFELRADDFVFLSSRQESGGSDHAPTNSKATADSTRPPIVEENDIPF